MIPYILRRLLLMVPTLLGVTLLVFALIQFVPGGPVEEMISKARGMGSERGANTRAQMSEQEIANIRAYFGFDQPAPVRYVKWLGNVMRGDFGHSYVYQEPVGEVIASKFPISLIFGITSFVLSYLICIPLGYLKALGHRTGFDRASSLVVLAGYVMPGFALGVLLLVFFAGGSYLNWFPLGGFVSDDFERLPFWSQAADIARHMALPLFCYMVGSFAVLTMLMKNSLLDELNKDYVRTALTKGMSFPAAAFRHALRNALIPVATGVGAIFTVMFAGALLIERVFDLDGMGKLFYDSMVSRDYNVVLALIFIITLLGMVGKLFSDILYVVINPRIRFD